MREYIYNPHILFFCLLANLAAKGVYFPILAEEQESYKCAVFCIFNQLTVNQPQNC
jgi:hypothetical protein